MAASIITAGDADAMGEIGYPHFPVDFDRLQSPATCTLRKYIAK